MVFQRDISDTPNLQSAKRVTWQLRHLSRRYLETSERIWPQASIIGIYQIRPDEENDQPEPIIVVTLRPIGLMDASSRDAPAGRLYEQVQDDLSDVACNGVTQLIIVEINI
jgi:hypothetical protein